MFVLNHLYDGIVNFMPFAVAMHDAGVRESLRIFTEGIPKADKKVKEKR